MSKFQLTYIFTIVCLVVGTLDDWNSIQSKSISYRNSFQSALAGEERWIVISPRDEAIWNLLYAKKLSIYNKCWISKEQWYILQLGVSFLDILYASSVLRTGDDMKDAVVTFWKT